MPNLSDRLDEMTIIVRFWYGNRGGPVAGPGVAGLPNAKRRIIERRWRIDETVAEQRPQPSKDVK